MGIKTSRWKKGYLLPFIMLIGMLIILIGFGVTEYVRDGVGSGFDGIKFCDSKYQYEIVPFYDCKEDKYYLFLPSHIDKENIKIKCTGNVKLRYSSEKLLDLKPIPFYEDVNIVISRNQTEDSVIMQILQSENVDTMYIETKSGTLEEIHADKNNKESISLKLVNKSGGGTKYNSIAELSGRGNSTWDEDKKPYNIVFDRAVNLMGSTYSKKWCLIANYGDESRIRNYLSYLLANKMEIPYTDRMEFVSLYINGEYLGLYTLACKNDYINHQNDYDAIFEADYVRESDYITQADVYITYLQGDSKLAREKIDAFENSLLVTKSYEEIEKIIDVKSFAKRYLLEELIANDDNVRSQFFVVNKEGKLVAVCAWDYDFTMGISGMYYFDNAYNRSVIINAWYKALYEYPEFRQLVAETFQEYKHIYTKDFKDWLVKAETTVETSWTMDYLRWKDAYPFEHGFSALKTGNVPENFGEHVDYIDDFMERRIILFDEYLNQPEEFCEITFEAGYLGSRTYYCKKDESLTAEQLEGGILTLVELTPDFLGWYTAYGLQLENVEEVTEDMVFYPMWKQ